MANDNMSLIHSEHGFGKTLAFICLGLVAYFVHQGALYPGDDLPDHIFFLVIGLLSITALLSLVFSYAVRAAGMRPKSELVSAIQQEIAFIESVLEATSSQTEQFEAQLMSKVGTATRRAAEAFHKSKRILGALESRHKTLCSVLENGRMAEILGGYDIAQSKLSFGDNCFDMLIATDPIADLDKEEWLPTLDRLFFQIEHELRRTANAQNY